MYCVEDILNIKGFMSSDTIEVAMAQMKIDSAPDILVTRGLGSCVGVVLYDPIEKIGGLAHPMLPKREKPNIRSKPFKYVDFVISFMIKELEKKGCKIKSLEAKLFGGAHMFSSLSKISVFNVGIRNIESAKEILGSYNIKIIGEHNDGVAKKSSSICMIKELPDLPTLDPRPSIADFPLILSINDSGIKASSFESSKTVYFAALVKIF